MKWLITYYTVKPRPPEIFTTKSECFTKMVQLKRKGVKFTVSEVGAAIFDFS